MTKALITFLMFAPLAALAQVNISGRVLNQADTRPLANVNIFLSNATIGGKTTPEGTFTLNNVKPGKYDLVVSIVGFETTKQTLTVGNSNIVLPDILVFPKTFELAQVTIKAKKNDPDRQRYYEIFKDEFLGNTSLAKDCRILNPEILDIDYDGKTNTITASSADFLEIQNDALGYKIKYLLSNFMYNTTDDGLKSLNYRGLTLFELLKGTPSQEKEWQQKRAEIYENSQMHFLRAAIANRLSEEGFRVLLLPANAERPSDEVIAQKLKLFKAMANSSARHDSLNYWEKKAKLPKLTRKLLSESLAANQIITGTDRPELYDLKYPGGALYISYNRLHHFSKGMNDLSDKYNTANTILTFNTDNVLFDKNGSLADPGNLTVDGIWAQTGVASLLPLDYIDPNDKEVNPAILNIADQLNAYKIAHPEEKAYLHFDKPYYAAGDTIYFKAYVVQSENHELSKQSGILHVDLINNENKIAQSIKLQLVDGLAWGDFALPDTLQAGVCQIRAYTSLMRNIGNDAFFYKSLAIGSNAPKRVAESASPAVGSAMADIQFMPEGGMLVAGNYSKIAFKAIGPNGFGVDIKGNVTDSAGTEVCTFASDHSGMGAFNLVPEEGKTYMANVVYPDGKTTSVVLPKATSTGYTLYLNNSNADTVKLRITPPNGKLTEKLNLIAQSGGTVYYYAQILPGNRFFSKAIPVKDFPTGILQFSLFTASGEPVNERLMFVNHHDELKVGVASDSISAARKKIRINLSVKDKNNSAAVGSFSLAVIDESKVQDDEANESGILTNLLLTSELKGQIENPNYYFTDTSSKARSNLDNLMLTQGYRTFKWKRVLSNKTDDAYKPEKGLTISGSAQSLTVKPLEKAVVTLLGTNGGFLTRDTTDRNGNFAFRNLLFNDSAKFILQALKSNGKNTTKLVYNKEPAGPAVTRATIFSKPDDQNLKAYVETVKHRSKPYIVGKANGIMLKEVTVKSSKMDDHMTSYGIADEVVHTKNVIVSATFGSTFGKELRDVVFDQGLRNHAYAYPTHNDEIPMKIVIDGVEQQQLAGDYNYLEGDPKPRPFDLNQLDPNDIETVQVVQRGGGTQYGLSGGDGVIIITTKRAAGTLTNEKEPGYLPLTVMGFYKAREFYSPKYDAPDAHTRILDDRSTVYWQPNLITDKDGKASVEYYNADGKGTYRVVIEGIDTDGNLGRQVYRYKVE